MSQPEPSRLVFHGAGESAFLMAESFDSRRVSGSAPQFTLMKGPLALEEA